VRLKSSLACYSERSEESGLVRRTTRFFAALSMTPPVTKSE